MERDSEAKEFSVTGLISKDREPRTFLSFRRRYGSFSGGSDSKVSAGNAGDPDSIPGSGSSPGEGNGNPLQHSCLENPVDGGA